MDVEIFLTTLSDEALRWVEERIHLRALLLLRCTSGHLGFGWVIDPLLNLLKLFKDVLIVKERVREFLLKQFILQVVLDALLNQWHIQYGIDAWSLAWVLLQTHLHDIFQWPRVCFRQRWVLLLAYLLA